MIQYLAVYDCVDLCHSWKAQNLTLLCYTMLPSLLKSTHNLLYIVFATNVFLKIYTAYSSLLNIYLRHKNIVSSYL